MATPAVSIFRGAFSAAQGNEVRAALSKQVVRMYRQMCRSVPKVIVMYGLEQTASEARHMLLLHFRKAAGTGPQDPRIVEMLLEKARQEFEETMQQWKQKGHLMLILQPEVSAPDVWLDEEEFFKRFLDGTVDEEVVWANWDPRAMEDRVARTKALARAAGGRAEADAVDAMLARLARNPARATPQLQ